MTFGLGRLGWAPDIFWAATPREIAAALKAHRYGNDAGAPARSALLALMTAHPDA